MSTPATLGVVGIGNAIVDVIAHADDAFLAEHGMEKGAMTLIDEPRSQAIYGFMGPGIEASGGSAGNTIAGIASLGGRAGYIGKVRDDALGTAYRKGITSGGVTFATPAATSGPATAVCLILVTSDAQRTMNTYLGACVNLGPDDIDATLIESAQITYLEGYLFDPPQAQEAFRKAARVAHAAGRKVSLSLSDAFCVHRPSRSVLGSRRTSRRRALRQRHRIDGAFRNGGFRCGHGTRPSACGYRRDHARRERVRDRRGRSDDRDFGGKRGKDRRHHGRGRPLRRGLSARSHDGRPTRECGRLGSLAAAEIISHFGGRPETPLKDYVAAATPA